MRKRRVFTDEFKAEAVALVLEQGMSVTKVARDLGLSKTSLRNWVEQAQADAGDNATRLTTAERDELRALRKKVRELEMEREILKKATAFFARTSK
jgi:transposase